MARYNGKVECKLCTPLVLPQWDMLAGAAVLTCYLQGSTPDDFLVVGTGQVDGEDVVWLWPWSVTTREFRRCVVPMSPSHCIAGFTRLCPVGDIPNVDTARDALQYRIWEKDGSMSERLKGLPYSVSAQVHGHTIDEDFLVDIFPLV